MITWDIENIVCATVEALLPRGSDPEKGLMIRLEFSLTTHNEDDVFYSTRILELVFQRPSNYTKVFSRVLDNRDNVLKDWENMSNHDSCWRSDGLRDVFQCYMAVRDDMTQQNPSFDFRENETSVSACRFGKYISFVNVKIEKDGDYRYKLVEVTPIDKN